MPVYTEQIYVPAPRRRHWIRNVVLAVIGLVLVSAVIAGYGKISQFFQLFQPNQSATVTVAAPQITAGQIHLQNTVIYATQDFSVIEQETVTDPKVQECHVFWIFDCQPVSVTETVTCQATMGAGIDYDANKPKLVFLNPNAKDVTITVVPPSFTGPGFTGYQVTDSSDKYGVTRDVTNRLINSCKYDVIAKAHTTQLLDDAKQNAEATIMKDAASFGYKATVVFDTPSA